LRHPVHPAVTPFLSTCQCRQLHLAPLRRVQNTAARVVLGLDRRAHITPSLKQLHWFPVRQRITYKVATFMHSVFHQNSPPYLRDLVEFVNDDPTKRRLRSATTRTAATARARTKLGDRALSVAAPSTWNSLPPHLRHIDSYRQFRKQLKHICSNRLLTLSWFLYVYVFRRCSYSFYMYIGGLQMLCDDDENSLHNKNDNKTTACKLPSRKPIVYSLPAS